MSSNIQPTNPSAIHRNIMQINARIHALNVAAYRPYSSYLYVGNLDTSMGHTLLPELMRLIPFGKNYYMFKSYSVVEFNSNVEALEKCNSSQNLTLSGRKLITNVLLVKQINQFLLKPRTDDNASEAQHLFIENQHDNSTNDTDSVSTVPVDNGFDAAADNTLNADPSSTHTDNSMSKVFIGNFPYDTKEVDLHSLVTSYGPTLEIIILRRQDGSSRGAGFIKFCNHGDAANCVKALDQQLYGGRKLNLKLEKSFDF